MRKNIKKIFFIRKVRSIETSEKIFSKFSKRGFTLVEMLLAIAILVVISGAILVSISSQKEKARVNRMFSEVSAAIPAVYMCIADRGTVNQPSNAGGNSICNLGSSYGIWPNKNNVGGFGNYSKGGSFTSNTWFFHLTGNGARICCNNNMSGCKILALTVTCDASTL